MASRIFSTIEQFGNRGCGLLILISAPIFVVLAPFLFGFFTFTHGFTYSFSQQFFYFFHDAISQKDSILWNPLVFSGFPPFVTLSGGIFSPIVYVLLKFFPAGFVYHFLIFLHIIFGAFFTSIFLKHIGVRFVGAYIGGLAFVFSQWLIIPEMVLANAVLYLPLLFTLLLYMKRNKRMLPLIAGSVMVAHGWFTVHWHYFMEVLFSGGVFALYLWAYDPTSNKLRISFKLPDIRILLSYVLIVTGGTFIGLIQLIPTLFYTSLSARGSGFSHWGATVGGVNLGDFLTFFLPHFNVPAMNSSPWIFYIGILPLFFAVYGFRLNFSSWAGYFSFLSLLSFFLSIEHSPLFWLLHHLPFMNLLHGPGRWIFITVFSLAILAGIGFDEFLKDGFSKRRSQIQLKILTYIFFIISFVSVSFSVFVLFFEKSGLLFLKGLFLKYFMSGRFLPVETYYAYIDKIFHYLKPSLFIFEIRVFLSLVFIYLALLILYTHKKNGISRDLFSLLVLIVTVLNFVIVFYFSESSILSKDISHTPNTVQFLSTMRGSRIFPIFVKEAFDEVSIGNLNLDGQKQDLIILSEMLSPNVNIRYGIISAEYFDEISPRRMTRVLKLFRDLDRNDAEKLESLKLVLSFVGARFIVTPVDLDQKNSFVKVFETKISSRKIPIYIYKNSSARPHFYFASSLETIPENEEAAFEKLKSIPEEGLGVFIECPPLTNNLQPTTYNTGVCNGTVLNVNGKGSIEIQTKKNTVSILKTRLESPQFLVFSENHLPGWKAYVDGQETPILTVGSIYMGVAVPGGEHEVKFEFTYRTIIEEFLKKYF